MIESEVVQCSWLEDLQHSIEEPWESQGEERRQEVQKYSQEQGTVVGGQGKEMGDKKFGDEGGPRVQH